MKITVCMALCCIGLLLYMILKMYLLLCLLTRYVCILIRLNDDIFKISVYCVQLVSNDKPHVEFVWLWPHAPGIPKKFKL